MPTPRSRSASPVRGSGVFVGGAVRVSTLRTGEVHTDGGIPHGTPDLISGGVAVGGGAIVQEVVNRGPVTTNGQNDMALDNLGEVASWTAIAPLTSRGPSGIGFVNFGSIDRLDVRAPIRTYGSASIATEGDGAIGVQVSRPLPVLEIAGDLTTAGGEGRSLVKGVQVVLKAIALSVMAGGEGGAIAVGGQVRTTGDDVRSKAPSAGSTSPEASSPPAPARTRSTPAARSSAWTGSRSAPRADARSSARRSAANQSAGPIASTTVAGSRTSRRQRSPAGTT